MLLNGGPYGVDEVIDWGDAWGLTTAHVIATHLLDELGKYAIPLTRTLMKDSHD